MGKHRPSKQQWRQAWRSWPDGFMLLGRSDDDPGRIVDFRILVANRGAGRLLGPSRSALRGALLGSVLPSWRSQGIIERLATELSAGAGSTCDVTVDGSPGVRLAISRVGAGRLGLLISPLEAPDGAAAAAPHPPRPSSNHMLASLSHELRNPLAGLTHALNILTAEESGADRLKSARSTALLELARLTNRVEAVLGADAATEPDEQTREQT